MTEIFKERVETPNIVDSEAIETPSTPSEPQTSDKLAGNELKATDELTEEENTLDIWEGLHRNKYGTEYFNIKNIAHEFPLKAQFGSIDKFIKSEMESKDMEMNIQNYEKIISDIENEIGTTSTETYKRMQKIFNYIKTVRKYRELKKKKDAYKLYQE